MTAAAVARLLSDAMPVHGEPATEAPWWQVWSIDPEVLIPVALAAFFYLNGLTRWRERSRLHSRWRTASYCGGLAVLLLALESPIDYLGEHHFAFHMVQHELIVMLAVPLILLGAPTTPSLLGLPRVLRMGVVRRLLGARAVRGLYRFATRPLVAGGLLIVTLYLWHLAPGWYDAALESELLHGVEHLSYIALGVLFWWVVIDPKPLRSRLGYPLRMVYLLVASTPKHFLGALIAFAGDPLYEAYRTAEPVFALSIGDDQAIAGLIMWALSQMMFLVVIAIVFFIWAQRSERAQREQDDERTRLAAAEADAPS
ncbi:MAG: cytochrome c oxidase assembly protein [Dehalococcoidia bacterium]